MTARWWEVLTFAFILALGPGCGSPEVEPPPPPDPVFTPPTGHSGQLQAVFRSQPSDRLTDIQDDGSLVAGLSSADPALRSVAARGLARFPSDGAGSALLARLEVESDPEVLADILFALGLWGDPAVARPAARKLAHADPRVRAAAAEALGRTSNDRHTTIMVAALDDADPDVRGRAALALYRFDQRSSTGPRTTSEHELASRDQALASTALRDPDPGVRWRAAYALSQIRGRGGFPTVLRACLSDEAEPLSRVFAVRGLNALALEGFGSMDGLDDLIADPDPRVAVEAARWMGREGSIDKLLLVMRTHPSAHVRAELAGALAQRVDESTPKRDKIARILAESGNLDGSRVVRRTARVAQVQLFEDRPAFLGLAESVDARDRAAAASLLATSALRDDEVLDELLEDRAPVVRAAALATLADTRFAGQSGRLQLALASGDPNVRLSAAAAAGRQISTGEADPRLVLAVADSLETATGYEMAEARQALETALGLPPLRPNEPLPPPATGRLLDRLSRDRERSRSDPRPRVELVTERGSLLIELYREDAPVHTESFLELVDAHFYDGLDFHRVVPNFVVQGLDPRGDGVGTGGRRLPDEFNPRPYVAGTIGMPHAGANTGGCQIFITQVPTPHLDGRYTVFGQVIDGFDVIDRLEAGDAVLQARRVDGPTASPDESSR